MTRKFLGFFVILHLVAVAAFAQIAVQKTTFVAKETNTFHANHQIAVNTRTGNTLVVWHKVAVAGSQILGRMVNAQGNAITGQLTLAAGPVVAHPSVAYNPVRNEFFLAYDDNPAVELRATKIFVQRLAPNGTPGGTAVNIATDGITKDMANFFPRISFNAKNGGYTIVWLREITSAAQATQPNNGLVGAVLTGTATITGSIVMIQRTTLEGQRLWGPIPLDIAYQNTTTGKTLVVFVQVVSGTNAANANYWLATLDPMLNNVTTANVAKVNNAAVLLTAGFAWGARLATFAAQPSLVFYTDTNNIKRRRIALDGKLSGTSVVAFKPPKNNTKLVYPSVAFATNSKGTRGLLIATQDAFRETGAASSWAQVLDATGAPLGAPTRVDLTSATDTALSGLVSALPHKLTDTLFRFTWFTTLAQFKAPGQTYENSGIVKLNLNVSIPGSQPR